MRTFLKSGRNKAVDPEYGILCLRGGWCERYPQHNASGQPYEFSSQNGNKLLTYEALRPLPEIEKTECGRVNLCVQLGRYCGPDGILVFSNVLFLNKPPPQHLPENLVSMFC